jgi:hypothetical protein
MTTATEEKIVAVIETVPDEEDVLAKSVSSVEHDALAITIANDAEYESAAEFGREVKQAAAKVVEFFEPMKKAAHMAHSAICSREKEMLKPLVNAEAMLKQTMGGYIERIERERKVAEAEAQRIAKAEADKKLAEALALEESGDNEAAASAFADAQMADTASRSIAIPQSTPKVSGVSTSKDWKIVSVDDNKVPVSLNGIMLRPVDQKAALRLIKMSKGKAVIPGITYTEIVTTSIRK